MIFPYCLLTTSKTTVMYSLIRYKAPGIFVVLNEKWQQDSTVCRAHTGEAIRGWRSFASDAMHCHMAWPTPARNQPPMKSNLLPAELAKHESTMSTNPGVHENP